MSRTARAGLLLAALVAPAWAAPAEAPLPALPAAKAAQNRLLDIAIAGAAVIAVGQEGVILASTDGKTWQQRPAPVSTMLTRVRFVDDKTGWVLGYEATILETRDGGATFQLRHHDAAAPALYDVLFLDAQRGLAVGAYGSTLLTADGGATWTQGASVFDDLGMHLNAVLRLPGGALLVAGERGLAAVSTDEGANWQLLDTPYGGSWFGALPHGENGAVLFGMRGNLFVADDLATAARIDAAKWDPYARDNLEDAQAIAARGWRRIAPPRRDSLFGGLAFGPQAALLAGFNGTLQKLDLAANTLTVTPSPVSETLVKLAVFHGRLLGVGRRGAQDLGEAPK